MYRPGPRLEGPWLGGEDLREQDLSRVAGHRLPGEKTSYSLGGASQSDFEFLTMRLGITGGPVIESWNPMPESTPVQMHPAPVYFTNEVKNRRPGDVWSTHTPSVPRYMYSRPT